MEPAATVAAERFQSYETNCRRGWAEGEGWRLLLYTETGETRVLIDHSGRERLYHSLDHVTEVGRDIGFHSVRVEEHF